MLNAIRRVISDVSASDQAEDNNNNPNSNNQSAQTSETHIIPMEEEGISTASKPLSAVNAAAMDTQSSLSDGSIPELHDVKDTSELESSPHAAAAAQHPQSSQNNNNNSTNNKPQVPPPKLFSRMDSQGDGSSESQTRGGSQTSSRDWGWFEDVHISDVGVLSAGLPTKPAQKKKEEKPELNRT